ncbi:YfcE family phosphodiesterase [Herbivorax sp. ANBcel31]|uniref:metallophosphoesterase family protein n=1 Tax=Herbivorax sp. ANBcel31 TaxID=3069754 RepID=UPI0027B26726|nr:YfcE family phosphodiesterase [Herbivorax sp. ANBcel31]MDQ2086762.1 YfcE family phosphodiesterase [Herbivorax sp. ANBcel31]
MKLAVIGDIHSNLLALRSAVRDIKKKKVDFIICTGDNVGYSPFPNEVIKFLKSKNIISIQGNYDKAIGNREPVCGCDYKEERLIELGAISLEYTNKVITESNREYLRNLPENFKLKCGEYNILVVHGSPKKINQSLKEDSPLIEKVLEEIPENILIVGHTHIPFIKRVRNKYILNPGSIGKPATEDPNPTYLILNITKDSVEVSINKVSYDYERAAQAIIENNFLPDEFAYMINKKTDNKSYSMTNQA